METMWKVMKMDLAEKLFISQMTKEQRKDFALFKKFIKKDDFGRKTNLYRGYDLPRGKFLFVDDANLVGIGSELAYEEYFLKRKMGYFENSRGLSVPWLKAVFEIFDGRISEFEFFSNKPACFKLNSKLVLIIAPRITDYEFKITDYEFFKKE